MLRTLLNLIYRLAFLLFAGAVSCGRPGAHADTGMTHDTIVPVAGHYRVALLPFGTFDTALVTLAKREIKDFYHFDVKRLSSETLPRMAWYAPRSRYRADSLLIWLEGHKEDSIDDVIGLTDKDISCTKGTYADWGIFGLGYMPGSACVISIFRLKRNAGEALLRDRFVKVLLHELGHNLGLDHCPTAGCMMEDAEGTIVTVDKEKKELCPECRQKLKSWMGNQ